MAITIQLRHGTAAQWTAANPTLLVGEIGLEIDTKLYKIGDGTTAWNSLAYSVLNSEQGVITLDGQSSIPPVPPAGDLKVFAKDLGGRMLPRMIGPSGLSTPLQPSFFQNYIGMISTGSTTVVTNVGTGVTSVGTVSHPSVTEQYGLMANFVTAGTAAATAGTSFNQLMFARGALAGGSNGFFMAIRFALPDVSYDQSGVTTGSRIFAGMTATSLAAQVASDSPASSYIGLVRNHSDAGRQDVNWQVAAKDATTQTLTDTGMVFGAQKVYDVYLFCAPLATSISWRIDNITDGTTAQGSASATLPLPTSLLRPGVQIQSVDAVVRNVRMQRIYAESDR